MSKVNGQAGRGDLWGPGESLSPTHIQTHIKHGKLLLLIQGLVLEAEEEPWCIGRGRVRAYHTCPQVTGTQSLGSTDSGTRVQVSWGRCEFLLQEKPFELFQLYQ